MVDVIKKQVLKDLTISSDKKITKLCGKLETPFVIKCLSWLFTSETNRQTLLVGQL